MRAPCRPTYVYGNMGLEPSPLATTPVLLSYGHHRNVTGLTGSSGGLTDSYFYDPFGDVRHLTGTSTNPFPIQWRLWRIHRRPDLSYMRARYYDDGDGRFTARDPINILGGTNLYNLRRRRPS